MTMNQNGTSFIATSVLDGRDRRVRVGFGSCGRELLA